MNNTTIRCSECGTSDVLFEPDGSYWCNNKDCSHYKQITGEIILSPWQEDALEKLKIHDADIKKKQNLHEAVYKIEEGLTQIEEKLNQADRLAEAVYKIEERLTQIEEKLNQADRLADAVQKFRNLKMLGKHTKLRGTEEYAELMFAWRDYTEYYKDWSWK